MALSVSRPQSFSGFCCECACLTAIRFGAVALNLAKSAGETLAVKLEALPVAGALRRTPSLRRACNVLDGHVTHPAVAEALGMTAAPAEDII